MIAQVNIILNGAVVAIVQVFIVVDHIKRRGKSALPLVITHLLPPGLTACVRVSMGQGKHYTEKTSAAHIFFFWFFKVGAFVDMI